MIRFPLCQHLVACLNASAGHKVVPVATRSNGDKAEPHPILHLLAKHRADADNIDAAQVLKRILGERCILEVAGRI